MLTCLCFLWFFLIHHIFIIYFSPAKEPRHEISSNVVCANSKAYAQSDQSLCWSLGYSINIKLLAEQHLEFLCLKGGCTGSSKIHICQNATRRGSNVVTKKYHTHKSQIDHGSMRKNISIQTKIRYIHESTIKTKAKIIIPNPSEVGTKPKMTQRTKSQNQNHPPHTHTHKHTYIYNGGSKNKL